MNFLIHALARAIRRCDASKLTLEYLLYNYCLSILYHIDFCLILCMLDTVKGELSKCAKGKPEDLKYNKTHG